VCRYPEDRVPYIQDLSQGKEQGVYIRAATQAVAPDLASLLRWAPGPPRAMRLQLPLPSPRQLRGPTCPAAPAPAAQPEAAPGPHVPCGSSSRCPARGSFGAATCPTAPAPAAQPGAAPGLPRVLQPQLPLSGPGQVRGHHVCPGGPTIGELLK
jgi:hypothetical protein